MVNRDIVFELDNSFQHEVYNTKDVFYTREYLYNFSFKCRINNNENPINNVVIYKNGVLYTDCKIFQNGSNDYEIKDNQWIKFGNNNYAVEVILEGGKVYKNDFYLKVLSGYKPDDVKIESFATYGLHENYSNLDIILKLKTSYTVDRVALYYNIVPLTQINEKSYISKQSAYNERYDSKDLKWSFIGYMTSKNKQYVLRHFLFDTTMKDVTRTLIYKAVVVTTNELRKEVIMSTIIKPNSMSLNTISYLQTQKHKGYDIFGGLVGKIVSPISNESNVLNPEFHGKIFELVLDKRDDRSYITIDVDNRYRFEAEKIHVDYMRRLFNKNQTNKDPNWFQIYGEGIATLTVDKAKNIYRKDNCRFTMTLWCGDDVFVEFNLKPLNDDSLAIRTDKTANDTIRYSSDGGNIYFDSTIKDKNVDVKSKTGFFTYKKDDTNVYFIEQSTKEKKPLTIYESFDYIKNCDYRIYNQHNFYYVTYDEHGIHIIKYDGINYNQIDYLTPLSEQTLAYVKTHNVVCFDNSDNILIRFINSDGTNVMEKVLLERNELVVHDCSDMVTDIFNEMRRDILNYVDKLEYVTYENVNYYISREDGYDILERKFDSMGYDVFNLGISAQLFSFELSIPISVTFKNEKTNAKTTFRTRIKVKCEDDIKFHNTNYTRGNKRFSYVIENDNLKVSYKDKLKNEVIKSAYERLNKRYFLKFGKMVSSVNANDFGVFRELSLYRNSYSMYRIKPSDVYGEEREFFVYKDLSNVRIILVEHNIIELLVYNNGELLVTGINLELKKRIYQYKYKTDIMFEEYCTYTKDQLNSFETLLSQTYLFSTTPRTMYVFAINDYDTLSVSGIDARLHKLQSIPSISGTPNNVRNSYMIRYVYDFPLNIKNRNTYLKELSFKVIKDKRSEEGLVYTNKREKK
jgi:hypothetical protein